MAHTPRKALSTTELVELLRSKAQKWVTLPNVTSVGVGYKSEGGRRTARTCIQVTVSKKLTISELKVQGLTPLPKSIRTADGRLVPIDIVERNYRSSYQILPEPSGSEFPATTFADPRMTRRSWLSKIMPGVSVSGLEGIAGTIGAIVYDNATGVACVLSNAHVLCCPGKANGSAVVQPGRSDDADIDRTALGHVLRHHVGLAGDCAIAAIETRLYEEEIYELGIVPRRIAKPELGDRVVKSGRTTGVTLGEVVRVGVVASHDYGPPLGHVQIGAFEIGRVTTGNPSGPISAGGDSGALWLVYDGQRVQDIAVGLHFASQSDPLSEEDHALACSIHSVLEKLDVSFRPRG